MNKSLRMRRLACGGGRRGVLVAPRSFTDPDRGLVPCPAAPLLAASAPVGGPPVRLGAPVAEAGPDVMVTVSYLDRDGQSGGLALVADGADGADAAAHIIEQWEPVFRSRRLLVADTARLCPGAADALAVIDAALAAADGPVYVIGHPVASPATLDRPDLVLVDDLDLVPAGARVVFPAHGVSLRVRAEAAARGLAVFDGTCQLVAEVQQDTVAYAARGDTVVVIGDPDHAVVSPLADCAGQASVLSRGGDLPDVASGDVSFVVDPAMRADEAMPVISALKQRYPGLRGHHFDVLCYAAADRAQSIRAVAETSDLMLVVTGAVDDPTALDGAAIAAAAGARVRLVTCLADIDVSDLADAMTIGLAQALSADAGLTASLLTTLSGLGPASVVHRTLRTSRESGDASEQRPDRGGRAERAQRGAQHAQSARGALRL